MAAAVDDAVDWVEPLPASGQGGIQGEFMYEAVPRLNYAGPWILLGSAIACILLSWWATAYFLLVLACVELWMMMRYLTARRITEGAVAVTVDISATLALMMQARPGLRCLADVHIAWSGLNAVMLFVSFIAFQVLVGETYDDHRPSMSGVDFVFATMIVSSCLSILHAMYAFFVVQQFRQVRLDGTWPGGDDGGGGGGGGDYTQLA